MTDIKTVQKFVSQKFMMTLRILIQGEPHLRSLSPVTAPSWINMSGCLNLAAEICSQLAVRAFCPGRALMIIPKVLGRVESRGSEQVPPHQTLKNFSLLDFVCIFNTMDGLISLCDSGFNSATS